MPGPDSETLPRARLTPEDGRRAHPDPGQLSALVAANGTLELRWYAPRGDDPQVPHDRDELYVVATGTAVFIRAEERAPFGMDGILPIAGEERMSVQPGDALMVPAGTAHRFEAMSADFGVWAIFYGPEGGAMP